MDTIELIADALLAYGTAQFGGSIPKVSYIYEREQVDYPEAAVVHVWMLKVSLRGIASLNEETGEANISHVKEFQAHAPTRDEAVEAIYDEVRKFLEGEKFYLEARALDIQCAIDLLAKDRQPLEAMWPTRDGKSAEEQANGSAQSA